MLWEQLQQTAKQNKTKKAEINKKGHQTYTSVTKYGNCFQIAKNARSMLATIQQDYK